ncbi:MAG: DUF4198 domain-containing protein [Neisseria sp.]|nr:DUF4198 domain-containing protein [Neisseria sp.]
MKKLLLTSLILAASQVYAHDVWVITPTHAPAGEALAAELGYSHIYPLPEKIAENRLHIFKDPMSIVGADGTKFSLSQNGENYQFKSDKALPADTYRVSAQYRPTFWVEKADGKWAQATLKEHPDAKHCEQTQMFGKSIVHVGNKAFNQQAAATPVGQELEIVPLANPNQIAAGALLPLQILYQGKPLAKATVVATADTVLVKDVAAQHDHRDINGYSAKTDKEGKVNFLPLIEGQWKVKVIHETPFADSSVCHKSTLYSTLIVPVGKERAKAHAHHHHHHH